MEIPLDKQGGTDFDWFGVDEEGLLAHFATAGFKAIPPSVSASAEDLKLVTDYFTKRASVRGSHQVDEESLANSLNREWKGERLEARYLRDFVSMANKGLFSYDIDSYLRPGICYFRVACPDMPLKLHELPDPIQVIVSRTILKGLRVRNESRVLYDATLKL